MPLTLQSQLIMANTGVYPLGCHGTPFLPSSLCTVRTYRTPNYSSLTSANSGALERFEHAIFNREWAGQRKSGCGLNFCARFFIGTPPRCATDWNLQPLRCTNNIVCYCYRNAGDQYQLSIMETQQSRVLNTGGKTSGAAHSHHLEVDDG